MTEKTSLVAFAGLMLVASTAFSQGTPGQGGTPGPGTPRGTTSSGPPAFNDGNTPGWSSMSAAERSAHQQRMQSFKSYNECNAYMSEMRRSRPGPGTTSGTGSTGGGRQDPTAPMNDACAHLPRS